ncbi:MAG TPA: HPF/RaiA family ribosome-associated protein [Candidatus Paceibacterota bacterium]|nr:HPF/RaiA family ribosome-associated protein [Candidatus Paceibacterota bacterium]
MNIRIKATNYQMTPETSDYLDDRIATLEKLLGSDAEVARCEVEVGKDAGGQRHGDNLYFAEFHILYPGGSVRATNRSQSINGAIDDAKEEAARQLRRARKTHIRLWRKSGAAFKRLLRMGD